MTPEVKATAAILAGALIVLVILHKSIDVSAAARVG